MKTLLILVALSLFVGLGVAQSPGHISTSTTVKVLAEAGLTTCFFDGPIRDNIAIVCFFGGTDIPVYKNVVTVGPGPGVSGSYGGVSWSLTEPSLGQFDWDITANGLVQSGTF